MKYIEQHRDLLTVPQGYMIAHCISADFALGAGVAKQIDAVYNMRESLHMTYGKVSPLDGVWEWPTCLLVGNVFNLVTKNRCYEKPTMESLRTAVEHMCEMCVEMGFRKVAMPKIGCGLDRLNWNDVSAMIQDVFRDTDVEILVCVR